MKFPPRYQGLCEAAHAVSLPRHLPQELQPVRRDGVRAGREVAPDAGCGGDFFDREAEAFNHQPAVVVALLQRVEQDRPLDMARPRRAAIVFARMNVREMLTTSARPSSKILLLDVGVERVKTSADLGVVDLVD